MANDKSMAPTLAVGTAIIAALAVTGGVLSQVMKSPEPTTTSVLGPDTAQATEDTNHVVNVNTPPSTPDIPKPTDAPVQTTQANTAPPSQATNAPTLVAFKNPRLEFDANLPPGAQMAPIRKTLVADTQTYLNRIRNRVNNEGQTGFLPWTVDIEWAEVGRSDDLISLLGQAQEYTGGAHGATMFEARLFRENGTELKLEDLFQSRDWPSPAVTIALCEALKTAKQERIQSQTIYDTPIECAGPNANTEINEVHLAPIKSDQSGKFGGLQAIYDPYTVGPYAEGVYALVIPHQVFAHDLKKEHLTLFAGSPLENN